jgi:malate dehydrogenase
MHTAVILGAGELGATLARRLAGGSSVRRIVLVDPDEGKARGKALDILQSGPVDAFDARVEGAADVSASSEPDVLVAADHPELAGGAAAERVAALAKAIRPRVLVVACARPAPAIDAVLGSGMAADRVVGSAPVAVEAALRLRVAEALDVPPRAVTLALLGLPPDAIVVPLASVAVAGAPVAAPAALRQAVDAVRARTPGPVALASAAAAVIAALARPRASALPVMARTDGAAGLGRATVAWPRRLAGGRVGAALEVALEPWERVALVNAAEGRAGRAGRA